MMVKHPTVNLLVDRSGRVYSLDGNERSLQDYGYLKVMVNRKTYAVHRLIAETFIPNPDNKPCVDHINKDRKDNRVENLRWVTHEENAENRVNDAHNKKSVDVYNAYGDFIRTFDSITEFSDAIGVQRSHVSTNMKRGTMTKGYIAVPQGDKPDYSKFFMRL